MLGFAPSAEPQPEPEAERASSPLKGRNRKRKGTAPAPSESVPPGPGLPPGLEVDPNEPRYCYCNQVSYGEMVGCDVSGGISCAVIHELTSRTMTARWSGSTSRA